MDSKHNNKKQLQQQEDQYLPPELLWENMEQGIFEKMEELQEVIPTDSKRHRRRGFILLLFLLGALVSVGLYIKMKSTGDQLGQIPVNVASSSNSESDSSEYLKKDACNTAQILEKEDEQAAITDHSKTPNDLTQRNGGPLEQQAESGYLNSLQSAPSDNRKGSVGQDVEAIDGAMQQKGRNGDNPEEVQSPVGLERMERELNNPVNEDYLTELVKSNNIIALRPNLLDQNAPVDELPKSAVHLPVESQVAKTEDELSVPLDLVETYSAFSRQPTAQLWMMGGASWWDAGFGSTKPVRAELEQAVISCQGQLNYVHPLRNGLVVAAGLQYQQLESRLDWNTLIDGYEIVLEDTIVEIQVNAITGEQIEVRGDVNLIVEAQRQVRHFNQFRLLQVPVSIGKTYEKERWQAHILLGGIANVSFQGTGRTISQAELVDYNEAFDQIWSNKISFSASLSTGFGYRITDNLSLITQLQYQRSFTNWSNEPGVNMRPHILNWSFGASYSL